jgi:hypothetical protein
MKTIWKFPFPITDEVKIEMPENAWILGVQVQRECPCIWALVDTKAEMKPRSFRVFGTGQPIDTGIDYDFIGTFQIHGGALVFHLFEFPP